MESFRKKEIEAGINGVCELFNEQKLTMIERWYVALCIKNSCEGIMGEGLKEVADKLEKSAPAK